jgi:pimeloyl-ACP methyl ester carboxylesterase
LYTPLQTAGDLVGLIDALNISSAVLVGHDWGATHAWSAALMRPDCLHRRVLSCVHSRAYPELLLDIRLTRRISSAGATYRRYPETRGRKERLALALAP